MCALHAQLWGLQLSQVQLTEPTPAEAALGPDENRAKKRDGALKPVGLALLLAMALGGFHLWFTGRNIESTDDAFIDSR